MQSRHSPRFFEHENVLARFAGMAGITAVLAVLAFAVYYVSPASADTVNAGTASATAGARAAAVGDACSGGELGGYAGSNVVVPISGMLCSAADLFGSNTVTGTTLLSNGLTNDTATSSGTCTSCLAGAFSSAVQDNGSLAASTSQSNADICQRCVATSVSSSAANNL